MNYRAINKSVLNSQELPLTIDKDRKLYRYLLDNNIAYYYSINISKNKSKYEKEIIKAGNELNVKYFKTLKLIKKVCNEGGIEFLLFKTFKHIDEAVDGDIDLFIKEKDFSKFLHLLEKEGFTCVLEGIKKAFCSRDDYSKIEPRTTISFHGKLILDENEIWKNAKEVVVDNMKIMSTTPEIDTLFMLLNMFYGPNYIKLYTYLIFKKIKPKNLYSLIKNDATKDLYLAVEILNSPKVLDKRLPIFPSDMVFVKWWLKKILPNTHISLFIKAKHLLFFYYAKYGYIIFNTIPFRHNWNTIYV